MVTTAEILWAFLARLPMGYLYDDYYVHIPRLKAAFKFRQRSGNFDELRAHSLCPNGH